MEKPEVTARVLEAIIKYDRLHGIPPAVRDIMAECNLSQTSIHHHMRKLERENKIRRIPRAARGIVILTGATNHEQPTNPSQPADQLEPAAV